MAKENKNANIDSLLNDYIKLVNESQTGNVGKHIDFNHGDEWEKDWGNLTNEDEKNQAVINIWSKKYMHGAIHRDNNHLKGLLKLECNYKEAKDIKSDDDINKLHAFSIFLLNLDKKLKDNKCKLINNDRLNKEKWQGFWEKDDWTLGKWSNKHALPHLPVNAIAYFINGKNIPLINGCYDKGVRYCKEILQKENKVSKKIDNNGTIEYLQDWFTKNDCKKKINEKAITIHQLIDQFFNLLDKFKGDASDILIKDEKDKEDKIKNFYNAAYKWVSKSVLKQKADRNRTSEQLYDVLKLKSSENIILYGPPGTGKTYNAPIIIEELENEKGKTKEKDYFIEQIQFHPSYDYEDFIEGIKPMGIKDEQVNFELVSGIFKKICIKAFKNPGKTFYVILDEINRANLSRVFGELMYCLEYRFEHNDPNKNPSPWVTSKYSGVLEYLLNNGNNKELAFIKDNNGINENRSKFCIPDNIIVIGTMNTADKSIDSFDLALRRRFVWLEFECDYKVISSELCKDVYVENIDKYVKYALEVNKLIKDDKGLGLSSDYEIGHSYFLKVKLNKDNNIVDNKIKDLEKHYLKPLLKEYCRAFFPEKEIDKKLEELFNEARKKMS